MESFEQRKGYATSAGQALIWQERCHKDDGDKSHQIHQEGVVPTDSGQHPGKEGGYHTAHLVHGGRKTHQASLFLRREIVSQKACREWHNHSNAHTHQGTESQQYPDIINKESPCSGEHI